MAVMHKSDGGPFPCHRGEYCGDGKAGDEQRFSIPDKRAGQPKAGGEIGLYLAYDRDPTSFERTVNTPRELMEPGKEHLYNVNGPGLTG